MILTKTLLFIQGLRIEHQLVRMDDKYMTYYKDYECNKIHHAKHKNIKQLDISVYQTPMIKSDRIKILIMHTGKYFWCPIFDMMYKKCPYRELMLLTLEIVKDKDTYIVRFDYYCTRKRKQRFVTREVKQVVFDIKIKEM
jgi:hypothetical protein